MKVFNLYANCTGCAVIVRDNSYQLTIDDATWLTEEDALSHQQRAKECGLNCHLREVDEDVVSEFISCLRLGISGPDELHPNKICDLLIA